MNPENLQKFLQLIKTDAGVASRVKEIGYQQTRQILAYAGELGLAFDEQDLQAMKSQALQSRDELSDHQLATVSGGWFFESERRGHE